MRGQSQDMVQLLTPDGRRVEHDEFQFTGTRDDLVGYLQNAPGMNGNLAAVQAYRAQYGVGN